MKNNQPTYLQSLLEIAEKTTIEHNGHMPQLCLVGDKGKIMALLPDLPQNSELKHKLLEFSGYKMSTDIKAREQLGELQEIYFISEAWVSTLEKDEKMEVMPREDPKKKEVLMIAIKDIQNNIDKAIFREIIRNKEDKIVALNKGMDNKGVEVKSYILEAFLDGYKNGQSKYATYN